MGTLFHDGRLGSFRHFWHAGADPRLGSFRYFRYVYPGICLPQGTPGFRLMIAQRILLERS